MERLKDGRSKMNASISCRELGMECDFVIEGKTGETVVEGLMRHVKAEHTDDWFEIEEIYQVACSVAREKAA
jgi:predicted small metal-binding protein